MSPHSFEGSGKARRASRVVNRYDARESPARDTPGMTDAVREEFGLRVLVCHSNRAFSSALAEAMNGQGYVVRLAECAEGIESMFEAWEPDLVLLELQPSDQQSAGWNLLDAARSRLRAPAIIALTEMSRLDDTVRVLDRGADDVLRGGVPMEELEARARAVLRRTRPGLSSLNLVIDDQRKEVRVGDRRVTLSPKEYSLLSLLASAPGRVFSSEEIINALWDHGSFATGQDAQKYIYLLRKKLEADPKRPRVILTVRGFGYRLAL